MVLASRLEYLVGQIYTFTNNGDEEKRCIKKILS